MYIFLDLLLGRLVINCHTCTDPPRTCTDPPHTYTDPHTYTCHSAVPDLTMHVLVLYSVAGIVSWNCLLYYFANMV